MFQGFKRIFIRDRGRKCRKLYLFLPKGDPNIYVISSQYNIVKVEDRGDRNYVEVEEKC